MGNLHYILECMDHYRASTVEEFIHPNDAMKNEWYFDVGKSAVDNVVAGYLASQLGAVSRVLDVPCGHGRVLRHLVKLFPEAAFDACDLDSDGLRFCAERFQAFPIQSAEDLARVVFPHQYDLIWVGSLFTHVDRRRVRKWLSHLAGTLTPQGVIVATFHGRWAEHVHTVAPYISEDRWSHILNGYRASGYGFSEYGQHGVSFISGSYGVSLARPEAIISDVAGVPGTRIFLYRERGWADHQDVVAFGRPAFDKPWPAMEAASGSAVSL